MRQYEIMETRMNPNLLMEKQVWEESTTCLKPHGDWRQNYNPHIVIQDPYLFHL